MSRRVSRSRSTEQQTGRPQAAPFVIRSNASLSAYPDTAQAASESSLTVAAGSATAAHTSATVCVPGPTTADAIGATDASTGFQVAFGEAKSVMSTPAVPSIVT